MGNLPARFGEHLIRMFLGVPHHCKGNRARFADWFDPEFTSDPVFDSPTVVMPIVVTFVSSLVHPHPISYMSEDPHSPRFMCYSSIPTFFTPMLVTGDNFIQLFPGWEGVGLAPYSSINSRSTRLQVKSIFTLFGVILISHASLVLATKHPQFLYHPPPFPYCPT